MTKKKLFLKLAGFDRKKPNDCKVVNVKEFTGEYKSLVLGNGGSWCRRDSWKNYKVATLNNSNKINYLWDESDEEQKKIRKFFDNYPVEMKGNKIKYIGIFGIIKQNNSRPIRDDIKKEINKKMCVFCDSGSSLVVDHKNDLYNDPIVLDKKTQTINDFQSLCNSCNLRKKQVCKKMKESGLRYRATNISFMKPFGIDFTDGNENFDTNNPKTMIGTFWYDPVAFTTKIAENFKNKIKELEIKNKELEIKNKELEIKNKEFVNNYRKSKK